MPGHRIVSLRLAALRRSVKVGRGEALEEFWDDVSRSGAPLVERIDGDDEQSLVTFLWRAQEGISNVVVVSPALSRVPRENRLLRLPDTDVWYRTYRMPSDARLSYRLSLNDPLAGATKLTPQQIGSRFTLGQPDPFNLCLLPGAMGLVDSSIASLPAAPPQPWVEARPSVARGQVQTHTIHSALLGNARSVSVYTPSTYTTDRSSPGLLLLFDAEFYAAATAPAPTILDNLIAAGAIPPLVAVMVSSIDMPTRSRELPCHVPFVDFLTEELLPWVRQGFNVAADPGRTIIGGASYGGLAATFAALQRSEVFGNVLSQSGSFWWSDTEPEWLTRQFVHRERLPLRFYLEVGRLENRAPATVSMLQANRHLRDVLEARGYDVQYSESNGGHDFAWWRGTLADGLQALAKPGP